MKVGIFLAALAVLSGVALIAPSEQAEAGLWNPCSAIHDDPARWTVPCIQYIAGCLRNRYC